MSAATETEWVAVACEVADVIRHSQDTTPYAGKTDLGGTYGAPEVYTEWGLKGVLEVPVMREWRFPGEGAYDHPGQAVVVPDRKPCVHEVPARAVAS